jgi:hypothetical protein
MVRFPLPSLRQQRRKAAKPKNMVFSYQNVTVTCLPVSRPSDPPARPRRPRFSFFHSSIVKKQTPKSLKKKPGTSKPTEPNLNPAPISIQPISRISPEQETSSPAAPPPSSVSGVIVVCPQTSQQGSNRNFREKRHLFDFSRKFPPSPRKTTHRRRRNP